MASYTLNEMLQETARSGQTTTYVESAPVLGLTGLQTRRAAFHAGGALLAGLGAFGLQRNAAAQATPTALETGGGLLLVQSFSHGSLFPTQGDASAPPYTLILWDAADRGFFFADWANRAAGVAPAERVLAAIGGAEQPLAAAIARPSADGGSAEPSEEVWALRLVYGGLGSDPGAVTYQGELLSGEEAAAWLGIAAADPSNGPRDLGPGFLLIAGLSALNTSGDGVRLDMA